MKFKLRAHVAVLAAASALFATAAPAETLIYITSTNMGASGTIGTIDSAAPGTDTTSGGAKAFAFPTGDLPKGADIDPTTNTILVLTVNGSTCKVFSAPRDLSAPFTTSSTPLGTFACPSGSANFSDIFARPSTSGTAGYRIIVSASSTLVDIDGRTAPNVPTVTTFTLTRAGGGSPSADGLDEDPTAASGKARAIDETDSAFISIDTNLSPNQTNSVPLGFTVGGNTLDRSSTTGLYFLLAQNQLRSVSPTATSSPATLLGSVIANTQIILANAVQPGSPPPPPPADTDGDGVNDSLDACPGTPAGATVSANGCPVGTFSGGATATDTKASPACTGFAGGVTVAVSNGTISPAPTCSGDPTISGFTPVAGAVGFGITGVTTPTVQVRLTFPAGTAVSTLYKCPTVTTCANFTIDSGSGSNVVVMTLTDNGAGDSDTTLGTITDPFFGGSQAGSSGSGAFGLLALLPLSLFGLAASRRRKKL